MLISYSWCLWFGHHFFFFYNSFSCQNFDEISKTNKYLNLSLSQIRLGHEMMQNIKTHLLNHLAINDNSTSLNYKRKRRNTRSKKTTKSVFGPDSKHLDSTCALKWLKKKNNKNHESILEKHVLTKSLPRVVHLLIDKRDRTKKIFFSRKK